MSGDTVQPREPDLSSTMSREAEVVCVGEAFVDLVAPVAALPSRGGASWCNALQRHPGGTAGNVASGLARLGISVSFVGRVGSDANGTYLRRTFEEEGVGTEGLVTDTESATGVVVALIEPDGQWTFIVAAGGAAHEALRDADLDWIREQPPPVMFVTGVALLENPARDAVLGLCRDLCADTRIYFDSNIAQAEPARATDVVSAMRELAELSAVVCASENELRTLSIEAHRDQVVVMKRGADGVQLITTHGVLHTARPLVVHVADVIGAGDAFDAAFIAAELRGYAPSAALEFANAAGALSVTRAGGRSMASWSEIDELAAEGVRR